MKPKKILIVDDDPKMVDLLSVQLGRAGYEVVTAHDGLQGIRVFKSQTIDLVLLDIMMPRRDGFELLRDIRAISNVPTIILSPLGDTDNVIKALELGADDYITKPFEFKELSARVKAAINRIERLADNQPNRIQQVQGMALDLDRSIVAVGDREVALTPLEVELLYYLMLHAGRLLERETLLRDVWGRDNFNKPGVVDAAIRRLRDKIEENPSEPTRILAVRGQGYRLNISSKKVKVFLCHSSSDKATVRKIYEQLRENDFEPWLDEKNLLAGQDWKSEISKAVRTSDVVAVCLSRRSVTKEGFVQKEIRIALDVAEEKPEHAVFIFPVRLENCEVPERLRNWQWVNYYDPDGPEKLITALKAHADTFR